jgi:hypothetical protein
MLSAEKCEYYFIVHRDGALSLVLRRTKDEKAFLSISRRYSRFRNFFPGLFFTRMGRAKHPFYLQ